MANSISATKRAKQNITRRLRNRAVKGEVRTAVKNFETSVAAEDKAAAELAMRESFRLLDSATSKGVMHRNTTSRKKSRMNAALSKLN